MKWRWLAAKWLVSSHNGRPAGWLDGARSRYYTAQLPKCSDYGQVCGVKLHIYNHTHTHTQTGGQALTFVCLSASRPLPRYCDHNTSRTSKNADTICGHPSRCTTLTTKWPFELKIGTLVIPTGVTSTPISASPHVVELGARMETDKTGKIHNAVC